MVNISKDNLVWLDLEMTGLDPFTDHILELATVITDSHLTVLCDGPVIVIHHSEEILGNMDSWNTRQHTESGLADRVRQSTISYAEAEREILHFLAQWVPPRVSPMCGNSICQDRRFLARAMPTLENFFHYRNIDVSTIKELAQRWAPDYNKDFAKKSSHLALEDIHESIAELKHYSRGFINKEYL